MGGVMKQPAQLTICLDGNSVFVSVSEKEDFEERAAIMEYQGGLERERAELLALSSILKRRERLKKSA